MNDYFMSLDSILRTRPTFLADVPHRVFQNTIGFSRFKYGPDIIVKPVTPKFKIVHGKFIRLREDHDEGPVPNPVVQQKCQRLRDLRMLVGHSLLRHRERQVEALTRRAKRVMKKNARMRRKGLEVMTSPTNEPSPLKQTWNQRTIEDVFENTDPWTPEPGESLLYSDYRPASSDDEMDAFNLVRWDDIGEDPVLLLDDGFCQTVFPLSLPQEAVPGPEPSTPTTAPNSIGTETEEKPEQPSEERHVSPESGADKHTPQVAHVGEPLNPYITPPSSQTGLPPLRPFPPQHSSTSSSKKRKASEDLDQSPTKKRRESLTGHEIGGQTTSVLVDQIQPEPSVNPASPQSIASPQPTSPTSSKKRKASDDLDGPAAKRQRCSAVTGEQSGLLEVASSGDNLEHPVNSSSLLNSPTVDKQREEQDVEQQSVPVLTAPFTDASSACSSLTGIHQPEHVSPAGTSSAIIHEPDPSLTSAHPLPTTEASSVNSCGNQHTGQASPSQIWFRNGWSCNLH